MITHALAVRIFFFVILMLFCLRTRHIQTKTGDCVQFLVLGEYKKEKNEKLCHNYEKKYVLLA